MSIAEFIKARIAELETAAKVTVEIDKCTPGGYSHDYEWVSFLVSPHGRRTGSWTFAPGAPRPTEVLALCAVLRNVVAEHDNWERQELRNPSVRIPSCSGCSNWSREGLDGEYVAWPCDSLRAMAAIWPNHVDYQQEWTES